MKREATSACDTVATIDNHVYDKRDEGHSSRDRDGTVESETIYVQSSEVGRTMGCVLNRIRDFEADSRFRIKVSNGNDSSGRNSVELSGSKNDISKAKQFIQDAGIEIMNEHNRSHGW